MHVILDPEWNEEYIDFISMVFIFIIIIYFFVMYIFGGEG